MNTTDAITLAESKRRIELEQTVTSGEREFVRVGLALVELRDRKLYRNDFATFEDYCHAQWGWGEKRASQIIIAAEVAKSLPDSTICRNEGSARALAKVEPAARPAILEKATQSGKVTAKSIREAADEAKPAEPIAPLTKDQREMTFAIRLEQMRECVESKLIGLTNSEMMKAAEHLKQLARRIESVVAKNQGDMS